MLEPEPEPEPVAPLEVEIPGWTGLDICVDMSPARPRRAVLPTGSPGSPSIHATALSMLEDARGVLRDVPIFGGLKPAVMRQLAGRAEEVEFEPGEVVFTEGAKGDSMILLTTGSLDVTFDSSDDTFELAIGSCVGELALLTGQARSATITASASSGARALRLIKTDVQPILAKAWGGDAEIERRCAILGEVGLFANLGKVRAHSHSAPFRRTFWLTFPSRFGSLSPHVLCLEQGERLQLATLMQPVSYAEDQEIVKEGKLGDCMYILDTGHCKVFIKVRLDSRFAHSLLAHFSLRFRRLLWLTFAAK